MDDSTISYSIAWTLKDIKVNDDINRDYLLGIDEK